MSEVWLCVRDAAREGICKNSGDSNSVIKISKGSAQRAGGKTSAKKVKPHSVHPQGGDPQARAALAQAS